MGTDREPVRRRRAGGCLARGALDGAGRATAPARRDSRSRADARHLRVDRDAASPSRRGARACRHYDSGVVEGSPAAALSHVDATGGVRMVDVGGKPHERRHATARAFVRMRAETAAVLGSLPKGDALATAQIAAVMAAKRTADLIPLCHPLPLSVVDVVLIVEDDGVSIETVAETTAQTGVEMEALTAASVAALTVYDMAKAVDKEMVVEDVRLLEKTKE